MAEKKSQLNKKQEKQLRDQLKKLGLGGAYAELIHNAAVYDWSPERFIQALIHSDTFRTRFPGLIGKDGEINGFLLGQERATLSIQNLQGAIRQYETLWKSYEKAGEINGFGKVSKSQMATLIKSEVSPDEFATKTYALKQVTANKQAFDMYNQQRRAMGLKPLERGELLRAFATKDQKFIDTYEAARLRIEGGDLGFNRKEAAGIARALPNQDAQGRVTGYGDVGKLISELRSQLGDIGPELKQAGIGELQLAKFLANPNDDSQGLSLKLQQLVATKRNRGQYVAGSQVRRGPGGGPTTYNPEGSASYG